MPQALMHELDGHCAFADRRRYAFHRTGADIAGGEHTSAAGFEKKRRPRGGPMLRTRQIRSGKDKTSAITLDLRRQPAGSGFRTDEAEDARCLNGSYRSRRVVQ